MNEQPWFHFEARENIDEYPFNGLQWGEWTWKEHYFVVAYHIDGWILDDGKKVTRCRDLAHAIQLFWKRIGRVYSRRDW